MGYISSLARAAVALSLFASTGLSTPLASSGAAVLRQESKSFQNGVYFTNWGIAEGFKPENIPVENVNNVFYAFLNLDEDGNVFSDDEEADLNQLYPGDDPSESGNNVYGAIKQLNILKHQNRHLRLLLSIGGWTRSKNFPAAASTADKRANFAKTSVTLMRDWGFDGIDVDWEYPESSTDAENFVLLLRAIRSEMDSLSSSSSGGYHFLLTAATSSSTDYAQLNDLQSLGEVLDYVNLMAYDYTGSYRDYSSHQANLFYSSDETTPKNTEDVVSEYLSGGVPAEKIILGMPIYGRSFTGTSGLGETFTGLGNGTAGEGQWYYKDLPPSGSEELYDEEAGASYSFDSASQTLISYDNVDIVKRKVDWLVNEVSLGGAFFWEASGDKEGDGSLITASFEALSAVGSGVDVTENLIEYPDSVYDNVRAGF